MMSPLARGARSFQDRVLEDFLDEIVSELNKKALPTVAPVARATSSMVSEQEAQIGAVTGGVLAAEGPGFLEYLIGVNDGDSVLTPGLVMGLDSRQKPAYAIGGAAPVRPLGVVTRVSTPGSSLYVASGGVVRLFVGATIYPERGDPCYVSSADAGRVINERPSSGERYLVGTFWSPRNAEGLAEVVLFLNLTGARTI